MNYSLLFLTLSTIHLASSIVCWSGWQIWEHEVNNVTKVDCQPNQKCCYMLASGLTGNNYGCYDNCPAPNVEKCGPDPKLGIQDVRYCYCKDHKDKDCQPYLGDK